MDSEKKVSKWKLQRLGMAKIIFISILLSLIVNFAYLAVETISVKSAKLPPIHKVVYGGECVEYVGIYWIVTSLAPLLSADEVYTPSGPIESFFLNRLLLDIALLAFAAWVVLALINRYFKVLIIVIGSMACVFLLVTGARKAIEYWKNTPTELCSVTVITSDIHPGVYNSIKYPQKASYLVPAGDGQKYGYSENEEMLDFISPDQVSGKNLRALIKAAEKIREKTNSNHRGDFAYRIKIVYKTRDGYGHVQMLGYESFPEEWGEFIHILNETCGMNYLREKPEMVKFSREWFSDTYGINDSDMPEGASVEGFFNSYQINMATICGMNKSSWEYLCFEPERLLKNYFSSLKEE